MDAFEQMAWDLEMAQEHRFKDSTEKYKFFDNGVEGFIFEKIKRMREQSTTFHPDNKR